jgi:hypothetical protein
MCSSPTVPRFIGTRVSIAALPAACLLTLAGLGAAKGAASKLPVLTFHELKVTQVSPEGQRIQQTVRVAFPKGWSGERDSTGRALRLYGPDGEGRILAVVASHPEELGPYLSDLKKGHPSAAPAPPEAMNIPGIRSDLGERATRFRVDGREVGEMVMIEKGGLIVLLVTVVEPSAWPTLKPVIERCYPTLSVTHTALR